ACFSPYHFHRIFSGMVGETVKEYIRRLRLERAAVDLKYTSIPVTQIAFDSGYETHESFTRAFRNMFDMSPKQYRDYFSNGSVSFETAVSSKFVATLNPPTGENMEARIEKFEPVTVAFVRHVGPYNECHAAWQKLCSNPDVLKMISKDSPTIGICYDDPDVTESGKIRYDACVKVGDDFNPGNGVEKQQVEGGDYAVLTHKGSYDGLHASYKWLYGEWLPGSGREAKSAPSLELYRNNPQTTSPEELITDICVPLK
ncbi:MAG: helix-turn-helix domain-containing protein, partial [candidate division Zixibacteria bacterium]|nr:helix-turn-helix domain-containing protein [candidate division Zixibacteria bacterium]